MHKLVNGIPVELSPEEEAKLLEDWEVNATKENIRENNRKILEQLREIDFKSIRSLRANELDKLAVLEQQAVELRKQIVK